MNTETNIYECLAFDDPAYCCSGPECKGCPHYKEPNNNEEYESPFDREE